MYKFGSGDAMRVLVISLIIILVGCKTLNKPVLLDTAPVDEQQLRYPEWAEKSTMTQPDERLCGTYKADGLECFLLQHEVPYEIISGQHLMIKLKKRIYFRTGSASVSKDSKDWLKSLSEHLAKFQNVDIVIDGHTDNTGEADINELLSQKRALAVKRSLQGPSFLSDRAFTRGYSEYMPACSNDTISGQACNRRVELTLIHTPHK